MNENERKFRKISDAANDAIITTDNEGNITYWNKAAEKMFDYSTEDVIGKQLHTTIIPARFREAHLKGFNKYCDTGQGAVIGRTVELAAIRKNGTEFPIELSLSGVKTKGKWCAIGMIRDITERKRMRDLLKESEDKFRKISDTANDAIIMINNEENIIYWNKAAEKIFGYSTEEVVGMKLHKTIIPDRFRDDHLAGFKRFCDIGQGTAIGKALELEAIRKDGTEVSIELSLSSVKIKGKWNAIGIIRDITERKRIEEELRISQKMSYIGRLSASVFHEILNPVNIISAHTQLLLMEAEKGSKTEEDLKSIQDEIGRIVDITDNLLKFSKKEDTKTEEVEINGLLKNVLSLIKPELNMKSIKPITKFEKDLPEVMAHGGELRQVFLNMITNAIDAMPDGGTLTVETLRKGDSVRITFEDTGSGIAKTDIDMIFEPFFSTKKEIKGVGIGLSTSYGIIENHGGTMSVESEEGKGTTFTIELPVKD